MSSPSPDTPLAGAGHILVVDDDPRIRSMLTRYFEREGFKVSEAENGAAMRERLATGNVDLIFLDLMLPDEDGLTLAGEIRAKHDVGLIMLTGRSDMIDRVVGLEVGADDYIPKPFHLREVLARTKSVLRRLQAAQKRTERPAAAQSEEVLRFAGWRLDLTRRQLLAPEGEEVLLTTGEFNLLSTLAQHAGRVLDRDQLMDLTRGRDWAAFDRTIDAQVARLRKKIERDPKQPQLIKSVRGVGYVFAGVVERGASDARNGGLP